MGKVIKINPTGVKEEKQTDLLTEALDALEDAYAVISEVLS